MRSLLLIFVLVLATASLGDASPYQRSVLDYLIQLAARECSEAGQMICSQTCDRVIRCVSDGQGGFEHVDLEICSTDTTRCSAELGRCVEGSTACNTNTTETGIECHDTGLFPDPYNCTVYHFCQLVNSMSIPLNCEAGYAYNALTKDCSYRTTDSVCTDGPVPACESVGQSGPLPTNPSIYYSCTRNGDTLVPELRNCDNGFVYDPTIPGCVDPRSSTSSTGSTGPTTSTSTTTTTTTTTTTSSPTSTAGPPVPGGYCPLPLLIVADPEDCTHYYECSPNYTWLHVACVFGFYFNPVHNRCELGWC